MRTTAFLVLWVGLALSVSTFGEITGPVVGFVRLAVEPGPQQIEPSVRPRAPLAAEGETTAEVFSEYLGEQFRAGPDASEADWIGIENESDNVTMIWKDQEVQWRDLLGNAIEPEYVNASGFWLDLAFDEWTDGETRELVLSGEAVW